MCVCVLLFVLCWINAEAICPWFVFADCSALPCSTIADGDCLLCWLSKPGPVSVLFGQHLPFKIVFAFCHYFVTLNCQWQFLQHLHHCHLSHCAMALSSDCPLFGCFSATWLSFSLSHYAHAHTYTDHLISQ